MATESGVITFDNTYRRLPARFYAAMDAQAVAEPELIALNEELLAELGGKAADFRSPEGLAVLAGNAVAEGSEPLAQAYAGHQFGGFSPQLGDGRALLLGEVVDQSGQRRDIQLKGSGPTPFSRRGDGRSALGPVLREYLVSEAMHRLGVPTTRALAAVATGENVWRQEEEPGGIFTRVAASHLRVGTFQYFAARGDEEALQVLTDYATARHFPEVAEAELPVLAFFEQVVARQADLIAHWMSLGFIHGVMNTDNCSISGETIDYGPCAFMDDYHPAKVFSSIDQNGRYAYRSQPQMAHWNLTRLVEALLPLIDPDQEKAVALAEKALETFAPRYGAGLRRRFCQKIGLPAATENGWQLAQDLLELMARDAADFTRVFRQLSAAVDDPEAEKLRAEFKDQGALGDWLARWREEIGAEREAAGHRLCDVNPIYIPRNHRIEEVIQAAYAGDFTPFHRLHEVLDQPFTERTEFGAYEKAPRPEEIVHATFCGT
ncbi:MAG: protein adenylyltransferase SelO [Verrucomicrobiales bacterium]